MTDIGDTRRCTNCSHDVVLTRGPERLARFAGVTLRVPEELELWRCSSCWLAYPTPEQTHELHRVVDRDTIGYDKRGVPVLRGT